MTDALIIQCVNEFNFMRKKIHGSSSRAAMDEREIH